MTIHLRRIATWLGILLVSVLAASAALAQHVSDYVDTHQQAIVDELVALLELPNNAADAEQIERNAAHLVELIEARGFEAQVLRAGESRPAVYGERRVPGADRTVTFYMHYDGQPVDPARWTSPPFDPVLRSGSLADGAPIIPMTAPFDRDARIYARSASDDKSPIIALLHALDEAGVAPAVNIKLFLEGEEEAGSPQLRTMLETHRDLLASDLWIMADGPVEADGTNRVVFGVRGVRGVEVTTYSADRALHSGHYGNVAVDAAAQLAHLIASMRDEDGRVLMEGFYDDVVPPSEEAAAIARERAAADRALYDTLAISEAEARGQSYNEAILWPAMNILGLRGGSVGAEAKNIIEPEASAVLGFRLVPDQDPVRLETVLADHVRAQGFYIIDREPDREQRLAHRKLIRIDWEEAGYGAVRTPVDSPAAEAVIAAVRAYAGDDLVVLPSLGGSLPLAPISEVLGMPLAIVPMVNSDNNQHAPDENLRIGNLFDGIALYATILTELELP